MSDYYLDTIRRVADLPLFAAPAARRTDPATSHEAADKAKTFASDHRSKILDALAAGPAGQSEIARRTGLTVAAVSKRLGELRKAGLIERDGDARSHSGGREARYRKTSAAS